MLERDRNFSAFKKIWVQIHSPRLKASRSVRERQSALVLRMMLWNSPLSLKILILSSSLFLTFSSKILATEPKFVGTFSTETIRQLWQVCSMSYQRLGTPVPTYTRHCDCAVDVMRSHYPGPEIFETMKKNESTKLSTLIRLNCNEYRNRGASTN